MNVGRSREAEIKDILEMMRYLSENTSGTQFILDVEGKNAYFSRRIDQLFDLPEMTDGYYTWDQLRTVVSAKDGTALPHEMTEFFPDDADPNKWRECWIINCKGEHMLFRLRGKRRYDELGRIRWIEGVVMQVLLDRKLDSMTGLPGLWALIERLNTNLRHKEKGFLMVLGVDNLKNLNAIYGMEFGNEVLRSVAEVLEDLSGDMYQAYRLDSDKFAVDLYQADAEKTQRVYQQIREQIGREYTLSVGAVDYSQGRYAMAEEIYQHAESALDMAKHSGKNMLMFFSADVYARQMSLISLEEEIRRSILHGFEGFYLVYQPQIDCRAMELFGAEALLRYRSASFGVVSPDVFVAILERSGLIVETGQWVLDQALKQARIWREHIPQFHISVNMSYIQLREKGIADCVLKLIEKNGVPGEVLTIEVTENIQLQDFSRFNKIFYKLGRHGVRISIDDFGTGYSSLSYLKRIEIDEIKIDRCFVSRIQHSTYNHHLLSNMIELAHSEGIKVCCEGVETEEELITIGNLHPDLLQGYLFSKPKDAEAFYNCYIDADCDEYVPNRWKAAYCRMMDSREHAQDQLLLEKEKLSAVVDSLEELVYVKNPQTHELLYLNEVGRASTGMYDYRGKKCYEVFCGRKQPCESCESGMCSKETYHVWEAQNTCLKKHLLFKSKMIPWLGEMMCLTIGMDIVKKDT